MGIVIKVNLKMINEMEKENMFIIMEMNLLEVG